MMTPKPTDRLKKICPAAASQVCGLRSALKSGFHMKPRPVQHVLLGGVGRIRRARVSTRPSTISAQTAIVGIAQRQNFSIPLVRPRKTNQMLSAKVIDPEPQAVVEPPGQHAVRRRERDFAEVGLRGLDLLGDRCAGIDADAAAA